MVEVRLNRLAVNPRNTLSYRLLKRPFIGGVAHLVRRLQRIKTEEVQVFGSENVLENEDRGPFLWLIKHESTYDFYYIFPLWLDLSTRRDSLSFIIVVSRLPRWDDHRRANGLLRRG